MLRITQTVLFIWHGWLSWKSVAHTQPLDVSVFQACLFGGELHSKDGYFWCPPRSLVHLIDAQHRQFCFRKTSATLEQRSVASDHIHLTYDLIRQHLKSLKPQHAT